MAYFMMYIALLCFVLCLRIITIIWKMHWSAIGMLLALFVGLTGVELFVASILSLGGPL